MLSRRRSLLLDRLKVRRMREREGLVLVEGPHPVAEALQSGAACSFALVSEAMQRRVDGEAVLAALQKAKVDVEMVTEDELSGASDTEAPQGLLAVFRQPTVTLSELLPGPGGRVLVLDAVQDPGNVGTLIRSAVAFGLTAVIALDGTADPWGSKAVRASAGAVFDVPLTTAPWGEVSDRLSTLGLPLLAAEAHGSSIETVPPMEDWALALGNEANGLRPELVRSAGRSVSVPMAGGIDSLNVGVAGSVLLYLLSSRGHTPSPDQRS